MTPAVVPVEACRRLLMAGQGLCDDPERRPTAAALRDLIMRLGFVQVDTINVVTRAQHLTLVSRLHGYQPLQLSRLMEKDRWLFEHWTHDASLVPTAFFRFWRHRFERYEQRVRRSAWWQAQLGADPEPVLAHVEARIRDEGPLRSQDFEHPEGGRGGTWWSWKPQKAALEYLWRRGRLAVHSRRAFQKVYDLTERVLPQAVRQPEASREACVEWACLGALERLGVATAAELAAYWDAVELAEARAWCERAAREGRIVTVRAGDVSGQMRPAFAVVDWEARVRTPPPVLRLLCPFDPILRDRKRAERLFGFHYRFEAFVPPPQRQYGYYVLPVLEGETLIGRADLKLHRDAGVLEVRGVWWEPKLRMGVRRRRAFDDATARLATWLGAERVKTPG